MPLNPDLLQVDHIIAKIIYAKVTGTSWYTPSRVGRSPFDSGVTSVECMDLDHKNAFTLEGKDLIAECLSVDQYTETKEQSLTEVVKVFLSAGDAPFTVTFKKADGSVRVLRGVLISHEDVLGRSMVRDFDVQNGVPLRQVDHRTISSLILRGVRYVVKGH